MTATFTAAERPDRIFEVRLVAPRRVGSMQCSDTVYMRRRLLAGLVLVFVCLVVGLGARSVLADRGGVPASAPAIRSATDFATSSPLTASPPAAAAAAPAPAPLAVGGQRYIVRGGDTLWGIAEAHHGSVALVDYVDALVAVNGGTALEIGQLLILPD